MTTADRISALLARYEAVKPRKPRVYSTVNPTPVIDPIADGACGRYMTALGFERVMVAYEGWFNRYKWWSKGGVPTVPSHVDRSAADADWGSDENHSKPPTREATHALARLAMKANHFKPELPEVLPLVFDIENPTVTIDLDNGTPEQWDAALENIVNPLVWAREVNPVSPLSHWATLPYLGRGDRWKRFWDRPLARKAVELMTFFVPWNYIWDVPAVTPGVAYEVAYLTMECMRQLGLLAKGSPMMCLSPHYQIRDDNVGLEHLRGKAVDPDVMIPLQKMHADIGFDLMVWADGGMDAKPNIDAAGALRH